MGGRSKGQAISSYDLAADLPAALGRDPAGDSRDLPPVDSIKMATTKKRGVVEAISAI